METLGRPDAKALSVFEREAEIATEPDILFAFVVVGLVRVFAPHLIRLWSHNTTGALGLTGREIDVLACVATGKTNAETAEFLSIASGTVKKHLDHIYDKLDVGTRTAAVVKAMGIPPIVGAQR